MLFRVSTVSRYGFDLIEVNVEASISNRGLPHFDIVGVSGNWASECKKRIRAAFANVGIAFPSP